MELNILSQPGNPTDGIEFYKDEGGKGNWMSVKLSLTNTNKQGVPSRSSPSRNDPAVELVPVLYFESGAPVEATDQKILLVRFAQGTKSGKRVSTLSSSKEEEETTTTTTEGSGGLGGGANANNRTPLITTLSSMRAGVVLEFRIQKVSRRKDNQRFMVKLSTSDTEPIFTRPITVLSKRKIPARLRNDPEAIALYKAEKMYRAQSKRAAMGKRSRSEEATPELRPYGTGSSKSSKKRARTGGGGGGGVYVTSEFKEKIEQMSHTISQLYEFVQDQRIQIDQLQEQVRQLNYSNMGLGFAALDGAFEDRDDELSLSTASIDTPVKSFSASSSSSSSSSSSFHPSVVTHSTMLTALDMLSASSDDISTTFDDSTEKAMALDYQKKEPLQWNFETPATHVEMPPLPVLNL